MNYCQDGVHLYFTTETQQFTYNIYGYYELQPDYVNEKPYFQYGDYYGLWWGIDEWWIGQTGNKGQTFGMAYFGKDVFCPHMFSGPNFMLLGDGDTVWYTAGNDLHINCKHIFINYSLGSLFHIKV